MVRWNVRRLSSYLMLLYAAGALFSVRPLVAQEKGWLFLEPVVGFSTSFGNFGDFDDPGEDVTTNGLEESSLVGFDLLVKPRGSFVFEARALLVPTVTGVWNQDVIIGFETDMWLVTGSLMFFPWSGQRQVQPYVLTGAGLRSLDAPGVSSENDFTLTVGGGARIEVAGFPDLRIDLRDYFTVYDGVPEGQDSTIQNDLLLTLALQFQLF